MTVQHATLEQLQTTHRGAIITPDDPRYDEGRRVWNAMIDRRPAVIVRCRSASDVMSAVNYGRDNALPIAVRGGAHGIAGMGTCNDGLVIDFAVRRPTTPSGVPSILASISEGSSARVTSTVTLNLNFR